MKTPLRLLVLAAALVGRRAAPRRRRGDVDAAADPRPRPEAEGDGLRGRPRGVRRPHRPAHGRDRVARRLHGVLRLARRPDRHQPPLRAGVAAVQLDPAAEPAGRRLPREDARGGAVERPGLPRLRHGLRAGGHRRDHREDRPEARRPRALRPRRAAGQGADRGVRGGRATAAAWRPSSRGCGTSRSRSSRSRTCASSTPRPPASATSAARPTTGAGPGTPATGPSTAPTWARTASPRPTRRTTCPTSRSTGCRSSPRGVQEGDLVFVVGYPGRTQRHQTYAEVKDTTEWSFPRFIRPRRSRSPSSRRSARPTPS